MRTILVVTGPRDSGKTRWCLQNYGSNPGTAGIITRKVFSGDSHIGYEALNLRTGCTIPLLRKQAAGTHAPRYEFNITGRITVTTWLRSALAGTCRTIVLDEIGPFELKRQGFHDLVGPLLGERNGRRLVFVIREALLRRVERFYNFHANHLIFMRREDGKPNNDQTS